MNAPHRTRRTAAVTAVGALAAMAIVAACASEKQPAEPSAPSSPSPVEKTIDPTAGNRFTPPNTAPPAATVAPGQHHPPGVG